MYLPLAQNSDAEFELALMNPTCLIKPINKKINSQIKSLLKNK